jgi:hypothetical protein
MHFRNLRGEKTRKNEGFLEKDKKVFLKKIGLTKKKESGSKT